MERPDPLEPPSPALNPDRFGHSPALWLVLPLIIGGSLDLAFHPSSGICLLIGGACLPLAGGLIAYSALYFRLTFLIGAILVSVAWHQLRLPPQNALSFEHRFGEFSLIVEQAHPKSRGSGWTGFGIITDRDDECFRCRVSLSAYGPCPTSGAEIKMSGHLKPLPKNSIGFDRWVVSQGATLKLTGGKNLGTLIPASKFNQWCQRQQNYLEQWWRTLPWSDETGASLLAATMLGRTSLLPETTRQAFMATGTLHLFAISGLHIAGMAGALLWIAKKLRLPATPAGIFILGLLWLYVEITGASPSSLRAWIMALVLWLGQRSERSTSALQSLALSAALTLLISPDALTDPGFQLSYLAVLAIITLGSNLSTALSRPSLTQRLTASSAYSAWQKKVNSFKEGIVSAFCVAWSATLAGLPLTLFFFDQASWSGLLANLILVPLSEIPLIFGLASTALSPFPLLLPLAQWLNGIAAFHLRIMSLLAETFAEIPYAVLHYPIAQPWLGPLAALSWLGLCLSLANSRQLNQLLYFPCGLTLLWFILSLL
jgi:competence protein ComEC